MFEEATRLHFLLKCSVGGGSRGIKGKLHGMGCQLDNDHVLTAWHVWREIRQKYMWPVVIKADGLFKCEVAFEQHDADLLVLRATEKIKEVESRRPSRYPKISGSSLFLGKTVGYLASLRIKELKGEY